jgi:hypothetical protein
MGVKKIQNGGSCLGGFMYEFLASYVVTSPNNP